MTISFRSRYDGIYDRRAVMIVESAPDGARSFAAPLQFSPVDEGVMTDPTIGPGRIDGEQFLQAALDHAWEIGLRPKGFADTTNQVAAIKDHLSDMRALVFKAPPSGSAA